MKRFVLFFFVVLSALWALSACKSKYELMLASNDMPAKYSEAFNLFNAKKYKKAAAMFESLSMLTSGLPQDDTVRYYWALSNYRYKDYLMADANFGSYVEMYPRGTFSAMARFLKLDCMYRSTYRYELDQSPTNLAIVAISEYMIEYPESDKMEICRKMLDDLTGRLDRKEFENARLYYKMEDYIASKTAFKNILKDNPDTRYREEVLYYIAKSCYKFASLSVASKQKERFMDFTDQYFNFVSEVPDSPFRKELDAMYQHSQEELSGKLSARDRRELQKSRREDKKAEKKLDKAINK